MHDEQDMRRMGALRKVMPVTAITFIIGWLAIAGVPPFSGFWSKDDILAYALHKSPILYVIGLLTALLTAFYMSRQVFMVFFGTAKWSESQQAELANKIAHETVHESVDTDADAQVDSHADTHAGGHGDAHGDAHGLQPHESPRTMTIPLIVLAFFAAIAGVLNLPFSDDVEFLNRWLEPVVGATQVHLDLSSTKLAFELITSTVMALLGISVAYAVYLKQKVDPRRIELPLFANGWYIDSAITNFMGGLGRKGFELIALFDKVVIDGAVNGVARATRGGALRLRTVQSGYVRWYALMIGVGAVLIVAFVLTQVSF
jgi:NADH-quinone oxidoreductase subunit L